jgi:hypothetical protein
LYFNDQAFIIGTVDPSPSAARTVKQEIIRPITRHDWLANSLVRVCDSYSVLSEGFYNRPLKLPIAQDRTICLEIHKRGALFKYQKLFSSPDFVSALGGNVPEIENGIIFNGDDNYWHYLILGLGTVRNVAEDFANFYVDAEISADKLDFLREFLGRAGYRKIPNFVPLDADNYRVRNCAFFFFGDHVERSRWIRKTLGISGGGPGKRIFVERSPSSVRQMVNSAQIFSLLRAEFGFEAIDPGRFTVDEQRQLFADATVVVGAHGAGLANSVFCGNLQLLGEFYSEILQPFCHTLARSIGASYFSIEGRRVSDYPSGDWRGANADFQVDEKAVRQALRGYL